MNGLVSVLKINQSLFERVVPFNQETDKLLLLDFTNNNLELADNILDDVRSFSAYINLKIENRSALYGIGGYGEHREVYNRSKVFDGKIPGEEPRRFHLGI